MALPHEISRTIPFGSDSNAVDRALAALGGGKMTVGDVTIAAEAVATGIRLVAEEAPDAATALAALDDLGAGIADVERAETAGAVGAGEGDVASRAAALHAGQPTGTARLEDLQLAVRAIDLTTLEGDDTPGRIRWLCAQAIEPDPLDPTVGPVAAVCVYPAFVTLARELLEGTPVKVASVAGAFPSGHSSLDVRLADITAARGDGAHEIDIVLNRTAFLIGDHELAADEIRAARTAAGDCHLKVIIEVGDLGSDAAIRAATQLAIDAGADVVKTSTGKTPRNATPAAVLAMAEVIADHADGTGQPVGVKVSGGVRTPEDALGYLAIVRTILGEAWMTPDRFRFGASGLLGNLVAELRTS